MSGPVVIAQIEKNRRERLRVAIDRFQNVDLIDLRICVDLTETSGIQTPTKKGVALKLALLPELIRTLQAAELEARTRGLLT